MQKRFDQLLIHGILHLMGYDHEKTQKEATRMEEKSSQLLKMLDVAVDDVNQVQR
jgi:probable rRNA maturation factor